jgi:hypothetical protein
MLGWYLSLKEEQSPEVDDDDFYFIRLQVFHIICLATYKFYFVE